MTLPFVADTIDAQIFLLGCRVPLAHERTVTSFIPSASARMRLDSALLVEEFMYSFIFMPKRYTMCLENTSTDTKCGVVYSDTSSIIAPMKWYTKIKGLMADRKIKQKDLIKVFNVETRGAVGHYLTGRREPNIDQLKALAEKFELTLDELLGDAITGQHEQNPTPLETIECLCNFDTWDNTTPLCDDEVELHFFSEVEMNAGAGRCEVQENKGKKLRFAKSTLKKMGVSEHSAACVTVSGNSMEPVLPNGATIGIDTAKSTVKDGDIYAINHNGHLRVKILYKIPGGGLRLRSYNSDEWPDETYIGYVEDRIKILGRVFWYSVLR